MRKTVLFLVISLISYLLPLTSNGQPKREFRGAWIQCVNGQFIGMGTEKMQKTLTYQLDELQKDGVNAIIFQVRPECDALYQSSIEPWSRFLTGRQGVAPSPYWDPLQWMVDECHKRGMELHAWINPFRAKTKFTNELASNNIVVQRPDLLFPYDGLYILDPSKQENRDNICRVAADIIRRYDVDGFHIDDYFYPYPTPGCVIPDGLNGDQRRHNVDLFIEQLHDTIRAVKPWVKFGVSPFGIYRNKTSDPNGSDTHGLQNYDDLYADILLWINKGWIDYCVPQLYWEIGHPRADYKTLIQWWNQYASARPLFIGEDIERTTKANQTDEKFRLHNENPNVGGTVLWYAKAAVDNIGGYGTQLRERYWREPALQPLMPFIDDTTPGKVKKVKPVWTSDGYILFWKAPKSKSWKDEAVKYVVYQNDLSHVVAITTNPWFVLPYENGKTKHTYYVTSLNRLSNEGAPVKKKVKL